MTTRAEARRELDTATPDRVTWFDEIKSPSILNRPTAEEIVAMSEMEKYNFDLDRTDAHRDMGPITTPQGVLLQAWIMRRLRAAGRKSLTKPSLFIQGEGQLGKTKTIKAIGRRCHLLEIQAKGEWTAEGHLRIPVVYVSLPDSPTPKDVVSAIARFYGIPGWSDITASRLLALVRLRVRRHETQIVILDELHFAHHYGKAGKAMNDHLKALTNDLPVTLILVGIDVAGFLWEGNKTNRTRTQMSLRSRLYDFTGFLSETVDQREGWYRFLVAVEQKLLLAQVPPGSIAVTYGLYLLGRTNGHTGSVIDLIVEAAAIAMESGREHLTWDDFSAANLSPGPERQRLRHLEIQTTAAEMSGWVRTGAIPDRADAKRRGK